ncbi:MAG: DUF4111 domain-containing protein [Chloroflexi bacterium]|nr:DUF4111 domain-containing protein [Chloroflexota bacterium]
MVRTPFPTGIAAADAFVNVLHTDAHAALGDAFIGMLLLGSLATGDFDPLHSDVDFLIVTRTQPNAMQFDALQEMHARIRTSELPFCRNYEGAVIPLENLRRYRTQDVHAWLGSDGHFAWEAQNSDWILQRHIAREYGVVVSGPDPCDLIDPITPDERARATADLLREWWRPKLADPRDLHDAEYQAYAILTMCRARYTLATHEITSKSAAARWLSERSDPHIADAIARALRWRHGENLDAFDAALRMIRETTDD